MAPGLGFGVGLLCRVDGGLPSGRRNDRNHGGVLGHGLVAHNLAVLELNDTLAHGVDDVVVVGGHHHGGAVLIDLVQDVHDAGAGDRVKVSGGLVGQQNARLVDDRAGNGDALLLTAGELGWLTVTFIRQTHQLKHARNLCADRGS